MLEVTVSENDWRCILLALQQDRIIITYAGNPIIFGLIFLQQANISGHNVVL